MLPALPQLDRSTVASAEAIKSLDRIRDAARSQVRVPATFLEQGAEPTVFCWPCGTATLSPFARTSDMVSNLGQDAEEGVLYRVHPPRILCKACFDFFEVRRVQYASLGVFEGPSRATEQLLLRGLEIRKRLTSV